MEDVLSVYERPYDPLRPQVCFDETSKELRETPRGSLPMEPGQSERIDYEYQRNGTANVFLWVEPLAGRRTVRITKQRTSVDFAEQLRLLVDCDYPDAERIVLVLDNLNTHSPAALYERFSPEEAKRINDKIEWHYTPEHASWLNIAEIELSVFSRQCLNQRIPDQDMLAHEAKAWQERRNAMKATIDWRFTTDDARIKLKRLYPVTKEQI
jgi:hypothetical protein